MAAICQIKLKLEKIDMNYIQLILKTLFLKNITTKETYIKFLLEQLFQIRIVSLNLKSK